MFPIMLCCLPTCLQHINQGLNVKKQVRANVLRNVIPGKASEGKRREAGMLEAKTRCFTQVAPAPRERESWSLSHMGHLGRAHSSSRVPCAQQPPTAGHAAADREHALLAPGQLLGPLGRVRPTKSALLTPSRVTQHSRPARGKPRGAPCALAPPPPPEAGEKPEPQGARRGGLPAEASGSPILGGHRQAPSSCPRSPCGRVGSPCCPQVVCKTPRLGGGSESWGSFHEPAAKVTHPGLTRDDPPVNCQPNRAP